MYDIGILGGMGSLATSVLFDMIIDHIFAENDQDYPDIVILNKSSIPDRTSYILNLDQSINPMPYLVDGIKELRSLSAQRIVIPCNTSHYFYNDIVRQTGFSPYNMIEISLKYILFAKLPKNIIVLGTLGTVKLKVYDMFNKYGLSIQYPSEEECEKIHSIIYRIKSSNLPREQEANQLNEIISQIAKRCGDDITFVLGCTELSALNKQINFKSYNIVDSMEILALYLVHKCGKQIINADNICLPAILQI